MKIYTKKGDTGQTSLIGGDRVAKHHLRIESYGTVDELNSTLGMVMAYFEEEASARILSEIQDRLFTIGSILASAPGSKMIVPDIHESDIELLEKEMDRMNETLPELKSFVLPAGSLSIASCHVSRCVCRRAERLVVHLSETDQIEPLILKYLNRLSDYLFVLARFAGHSENIPEVSWKPRL
ncbi:MAG: cob(I)yrinic acid a,c-diamide adenosyltransferase [Bacteroidia bacterium]|nr:cob(I)yrinic acid a,c-diamide adenosyltransferase [Bacteroidia bacterium]